MAIFLYPTVIGQIGIQESGGRLTRLYLPSDPVPPDDVPEETPALREAAAQLRRYLAGELKTFDLPLAPAGTAFQRLVWTLLTSIPCGETATYGELAHQAGRPGAARAVGLACRYNPLPIFLPCHRVVGAGGKLTGYRGGLELKQRLLAIEQSRRQE